MVGLEASEDEPPSLKSVGTPLLTLHVAHVTWVKAGGARERHTVDDQLHGARLLAGVPFEEAAATWLAGRIGRSSELKECSEHCRVRAIAAGARRGWSEDVVGRVCIFRALVCVFYGSNRALVRGVVDREACVVPMLVPVSLIGPYPPTMSKYEHVHTRLTTNHTTNQSPV